MIGSQIGILVEKHVKSLVANAVVVVGNANELTLLDVSPSMVRVELLCLLLSSWNLSSFF